MLNEIFTFENLYGAYKNCRLSKQHKSAVIRFEMDLSRNLHKLVSEFEKGKYKFGGYKLFTIHDPKERMVEASSFRDRIVIRCLCDNALQKHMATLHNQS